MGCKRDARKAPEKKKSCLLWCLTVHSVYSLHNSRSDPAKGKVGHVTLLVSVLQWLPIIFDEIQSSYDTFLGSV